jgi:2-C-methyl-D-erythritol 4-phosphate cytidylyltransferase/2-C-methyl-D-erythritol 2,4-cyclodiphosphate synthase
LKTYAAILAAGSGTRFGADKTQALLGRKPLWRWSFDTYTAHPLISGVVLVGSDANLTSLKAAGALAVVQGGATRQESSLAALNALPDDAEAILLQDAARPFTSQQLISDVVYAIDRSGAAAAAIPVVDTIKQMMPDKLVTLDRGRLAAMQTPQGAKIELLRKAHELATGNAPDDMALVEAVGIHPELVPGDVQNFKITTPEDLARARALIGSPETRTGIGYDIHPFSNDPARTLYLGGVSFPGHAALEGHSDADVLLHAATDALLGAAGLGDIGQHFPNTDPRWRGEPSLTFLRHAADLLRAAGWRVVNLDMTAIAESPKIMAKSEEIRTAVGKALEIDPSRVSVKATTNEGLGSIGRSEGIAAVAIATLVELY